MKKVLMIIGMHRSGTSLVTQWVNRCGLHVGSKLLDAGIGNLDGHYEDEDFLELHRKFLKNRGLRNSGLIDTSIDCLHAEEQMQIENLIKRKNHSYLQWGWKEPRTCLFLREYRELIPSAYYLIVIRGFNDTINSLIMRDHKLHEIKFRSKRGLSKLKWQLYKRKSLEHFYKTYAETYLRIWINYYDHIIKHVSKLPASQYMFVQYDDLIHNDKTYFNFLRYSWQFSLQYTPFSEIFKTNLISNTRDIEKYIKDKSLIARAKQVSFICWSFYKYSDLKDYPSTAYLN